MLTRRPSRLGPEPPWAGASKATTRSPRSTSRCPIARIWPALPPQPWTSRTAGPWPQDQARSGSPITPTTTGNLSLTGINQQRPVLVAGVDPYLPEDQRTFAQTGSSQSMAYFNLAAFAPNTPGNWGNVPKGFLRGPGFWNVDLAFSRNIAVGNEKRVELDIERTKHWIGHGAQLTDKVADLYKQAQKAAAAQAPA